MKKIFLVALFIITNAIGFAHPSYTGYSGATSGSKGTCASSCHGSGTGTITVTGFPITYEPGKAYTISVQYTSGSTISNFNASTRKGSTSTVAGTFTAGTNTTTYSVSGYENGIRASVNNISSANFTWTAPAAGTGDVTFHLAGMQGTSKSGPNTKITLTATEQSATQVKEENYFPKEFSLEQNYPNPFNPNTVISYHLSINSYVNLKVFDVNGKEIVTLVNEKKEAGNYSVQFDASKISSGIYFYRLQSGETVITKKMTLLK